MNDATSTPDGDPVACGNLSPAALPSGTLFCGRYRLGDVLEATETTIRYAAHDLARCWGCHTDLPEEGMQFCEECGSRLADGAPCEVTQLLTDELVIGEVLADDDGTRFTVSYAAPQVDDEATFDLLAPPPPVLLPVAPPPSVPQERGNGTTAAPPHGAHTVMLTAGQASHVGQVRPVDEDAAMAITMNALRTPAPGRQSLGLYLVADGMGGGFFGEVASALAMQTISKRLLAEVLTPLLLNQQLPTQNIGAIIVESVQDANTRITDFSICSQAQAGSTVTLALLIGAFAYIANVGDSRTYLYRQGTLRRISKDHSRVEEYVDQGLITPEMVYTHPERNGITRSLGVGWVQVDLFTEQLQSGDRLLLCCDGVWEMVHDAELAETIGTLPPQQSCDEIIRRANACGADDNISLVIVGVEPSQSE